MKHKSRRFLSLLLALAMCLGLMSPYAWAAEVEEVEPEESVTEVETEETAEIEASSDAEDTVEAETSVENGDAAVPEESSGGEDVTEAEAPADEEQSTESDTPAVEEETTEAEEPTDSEEPTESENPETALAEETVEETVSEEAMFYSAPENNLNTNYTLTGDGAADVYAVANAQLGRKYEDFKGFHFRAWCADFVSACAAAANQSKAVPGSASVDGIWDNIKTAGGKEHSKSSIQAGSYVPKIGDIIIFKSDGASHVGIVHKTSGTTIYYIDGNNTTYGNGYDACVHYSNCSFSSSKLTCVLAPKYSYTKPAAPTIKSWSSAWENDLINLTINWNAVNGATSYEIKWRRDDGEYSDNAAITVSSGTTYTKKGLSPDHNYYFRVYAKNSAGTSERSETINCCKRPTISSGTANSTSSITIMWGAVGNADTYTVRRKLSTESEDGYTEIKSGISGTSFTDNTAAAGTTYHYQVRAFNDKGNSRYSSRFGVTALCDTPEMTHWAADGPYSVTIGWNQVANAQSYEIHRNTYVNGPYDYYSTVSAATSSFTDTGVAPGNEYGYRVYAINADGVKSAKPSSYYKVVVPYPETAKHAIDLNRLLDGTEHWELAECATADIWVNGTLVADDVSDYWGEWQEGSSYEVRDIKTKTGYRFEGIQSGSMSGVVGGGDVDLRLMFSTVYHQLDLNGTRDGNYIYSLEDCATVDVYLNGNLVADDVIDYCENLQEGTNYEFRDLKVKSGYKFEGIVEGSESGTIGGYTVVNFAFSTKYEASPGTQVIPDGWYMIVSGNDDDWVLDVKGWQCENGTNVELYHRNNTTNQRFYLEYLNNGFYSIRVQHSGKYLHKQDEHSFNTNVYQWDGCDSNNAQWKIEHAENGYFYLEARSGGYLDNVDGNAVEANNVRVFDFNGSNAQRWHFVSTSDREGGEQLIPDGWYTINSGTDNSFVLDVCNWSMENGGTICLWNDDYSSKQIFYVEYQGDGYYTMRSLLNGKTIRTAAADGWCESVIQWDGVDKHSRWCLESAGNGYYYVRFENGNYLDHTGTVAYPLSTVISYMFNGGATQKWKFTPYDNSLLKPVTTSNYMGHIYEFFYVARTWEEANEICNARGGHLATITSEDENRFLTERLIEGNTYWLGGTDKDHEGTFTWITGEPFDYANWSEGEPNNDYGLENYAEVYSNGKWNDAAESTLRLFVCEYDPAPPINTETYQNHVYELYDTAMTWDEARRFCDAKGGHLVTITSQGENNAVSELLLSDPYNWSFWIAANDMEQEGTFVWSTGEAFQYSSWADGEPNNINNAENAAHTSKTGAWYDAHENTAFPFVCEYDPEKTSVSTCEITLSETDFTYDGNAKTPAVTVKHNNDTLTEGVHYTVSYQNNINVGIATVTITGKGDYVGSMEKSFTITKPAEPDPQPVDPDVVFQVGNAAGSPGAEVTIPVSLTKNSGIAGFTLDVVYDHSVLTLKNAAAGDGVGGMFSTNGDLVNWYADENVTSTGTLFNLTFEISGTAASGDTEVSLTMHSGMPNVVDENSDNVATEFKAGAVTIRSYVSGDVTGDSNVTIADVVKINRYVIGKVQLDAALLLAADVTGDGNVTIADVVKVNRFVIGKIETLELAPKRLLMRSFGLSPSALLGAPGAVVTVDSADVEPGAIAEIPIRISGNTGFAGFAFELSVPSGVTLNSVKVGSVLNGGLLSTNGNVISWYTGDNITDNDVLLKLNVTAPSDPGDYTISIALKDGDATNFTDENSDNVSVTFEAGVLHVSSGACEHEWDEGTITTEASCTVTGEKTFTCSKCGETKTETILALGHSYDDVVTPPTCRDQGFTTHTCERCDDKYTDSYTDIVDHDYHGTVFAPTCTTEGYTKYVCSFCSDTYYDQFVTELDHDYDDGVVTTAAAENTDGEILYTCQRCGHTETETIPAFGHVFDDGVVTREPTCTEDGELTYTCIECGEIFTESIEAPGHDYTDTVTAPTCTERGYTTHACKNCSHSFDDTYTNALGHSWGNGVETKPATMTENGVKTFTCGRCDATKTEDIPKLEVTELTSENVTLSEASVIFNGKEQKPAVTVTYNGTDLTEGTDYTVEYRDNIHAGQATIIVTGTGSYVGHASKTFQIQKASQNLTVTASASMYIGNTQNVKISGIGAISCVSSNTKAATVTAKGVVTAKAAGTTAITVKAAGDADHKDATKKVNITVKACAAPVISKLENVSGGIKITWGKTTGAVKYAVYSKTGSGTWKKLGTTTATSYTWKGAKHGVTYKFSIRCVTRDDKSFAGSFNNVGKSTTYVAAPVLSSVKNNKAKTVTAAWKKLTGVNGFEIQYSTNKNFKSGVKTAKAGKATATSQAITGLTKNKTWYFRIRTYKTVSGKKVYSAWSAVKNIKVKK